MFSSCQRHKTGSALVAVCCGFDAAQLCHAAKSQAGCLASSSPVCDGNIPTLLLLSVGHEAAPAPAPAPAPAHSH
ncbi:hypothetical protein JOB18_034946 [Solea senegalensis]|uniref:Secreted protein n=1 Tax=Solea senegalensis TaxID=28829 RepID=A0AAV6REX9_SOLSE|nr:hypothetical protein JOB18_034946 [Solea senegalensis]